MAASSPTPTEGVEGQSTVGSTNEATNTIVVIDGDNNDPNKRVGSILNDLEVAETLVANLTLDEIDDMVNELELGTPAAATIT
ncbi:hypothetical protein E2562_038968 [Oryza meyeriana var. granulata]|uniref:Uncharacterized protein n=1 Tax=Oryza meyeriana var. granulata TaxID=110450 RepID=A0A6G1FGZ4_9ORYZ|nr:hypothetical protein E2562_038968 [Oryza meyeriana var. granulata]